MPVPFQGNSSNGRVYSRVRDSFRVGSVAFVRSDKSLYKLSRDHHDLNPGIAKSSAQSFFLAQEELVEHMIDLH
jgi:hypothetical protein